MQHIHFEESVVSILKRDQCYDGQAYFFLKEALDFTLKRFSDEAGGRNRHVSGKELLEGFRDYALEQYGPMAATLMEEWGIRESRDVGNMVFRLIEEQVFGKQDSDKPEDFEGLFDLDEALRTPFLPSGSDAHVGCV
ncbi:MAG: Minf_1886 family protein [Verrucomicrobiota bacterium]